MDIYFLKKLIILIFLILLLTFYILKIKPLIYYKKNNLVCMCTPAKEENKYIKEFIEHYKNYGVDKIFLYDNNDIDGEKFDDIINEYIKTKFVVVVNFRGKKMLL